MHRLVALAFIPNPNNYPQINHKDEDKGNNNVDNLEWCTAKYNMNYGSVKYAKAKKVVALNRKTNQIATYKSMREASVDTGVSMTMISNCCNQLRQNTKYIFYFSEED